MTKSLEQFDPNAYKSYEDLPKEKKQVHGTDADRGEMRCAPQ